MTIKICHSIIAKSNLLYLLKLVPNIFYQISIFCQTIALKKLWKIISFHLKSSFRSRDVQIFVFCLPLFFLSVSHCLRGWSKSNLKVYDIINCLNKNLITHFVWYVGKEKKHDIETLSIDRVLHKEHFYWKIMQQNVHQKLVLDLFLILVNNPKQPLHARSYFKNKIFWKRIVKKL